MLNYFYVKTYIIRTYSFRPESCWEFSKFELFLYVRRNARYRLIGYYYADSQYASIYFSRFPPQYFSTIWRLIIRVAVVENRTIYVVIVVLTNLRKYNYELVHIISIRSAEKNVLRKRGAHSCRFTKIRDSKRIAELIHRQPRTCQGKKNKYRPFTQFGSFEHSGRGPQTWTSKNGTVKPAVPVLLAVATFMSVRRILSFGTSIILIGVCTSRRCWMTDIRTGRFVYERHGVIFYRQSTIVCIHFR